MSHQPLSTELNESSHCSGAARAARCQTWQKGSKGSGLFDNLPDSLAEFKEGTVSRCSETSP